MKYKYKKIQKRNTKQVALGHWLGGCSHTDKSKKYKYKNTDTKNANTNTRIYKYKKYRITQIQNKLQLVTGWGMFTRRHSGGDCLSFTAEGGGVHSQTA